MKIIPNWRSSSYLARVGIFLVTAALIAGMAGCVVNDNYYPPSQNLEIQNWYDLDAVRNNLNGNHILLNDLDSSTPGYEELAGPMANEGRGWDPIGGFYHSFPPAEHYGFTGTFDGQGYEIHGLFINRSDEWEVGLFGAVGREGAVENIGVVNATVTGDSCVGSLVGWNLGTVSNSYSSANVTGDRRVGGLVGITYDTVTNSYSAGNVTGNLYVGGLVGVAGSGGEGENSGIISNSYSTASVSGGDEVGGLVGGNFGSPWEQVTVSESYATGSVTGNKFVGGLVGCNGYEATVSNSYSTGNVTGYSDVGGLVGLNGGEAGMGGGSTVTDSYSTGSVTGNSSVGGLVGYNNATVSSSFWDIQTSGQATSAGGTGKNTTEMQDIGTFSVADWNITEVALNETNSAYMWNIVNNVTYPFLSWQS